MRTTDPDEILALLRDSRLETREIADATGTPREEAARAARLVLGIARAKPEEVATLPPALALAVLRAALAAGRADVLAAAGSSACKDVVKEAKRGLHILKTRGVAVPEPARPAFTPPPVQAEAPLPCYASTIDGQGERAMWIARVVPGRGVEVGQAVVSDRAGLVELQVGWLGRKEYRTFGKGILERGRTMGVAEIDFELARALAAEARQLNEGSGRAVPEGADAWLARLGPAGPVPDPAARFPALPDEAEREAVEASGLLHDLPLLRGWHADEDALRALALKLEEIAVSPLYIDDDQRAGQAARTIADAVTAYFDDKQRSRWARRLLWVAAHLQSAGDAPHAGLAAAAARALLSGAEASRIPFARLLVEKAFPPGAEGVQRQASPAEAAGPLIAPAR